MVLVFPSFYSRYTQLNDFLSLRDDNMELPFERHENKTVLPSF